VGLTKQELSYSVGLTKQELAIRPGFTETEKKEGRHLVDLGIVVVSEYPTYMGKHRKAKKQNTGLSSQELLQSKKVEPTEETTTPPVHIPKYIRKGSQR